MNLKTLGWAAYLAVSWTWCIGMFFPVLLVRDYGIWGFVVFAVPNVVGAAAMGWVLCRDGMSEHLVHRHRHAMVAFSAVTAAFHGYWFIWLLGESNAGIFMIAFTAGFGVLFLGPLLSPKTFNYEEGLGRVLWKHAPIMLATSLIVGVVLYSHGDLGVVEARPTRPAIGAWYVLLPSILGFGLCPYLDLTFHHARQQLRPSSAKLGFTVGFGVLFFCMILLTLLSSDHIVSWLNTESTERDDSWFAWLFGFHAIIQATATILYHGLLTKPAKSLKTGVQTMALIAIGAGVFGGFLFSYIDAYDWSWTVAGLSIGELLYRCFMVFYGLVFPAYVWLCMWPTRDGHSGIKGRDGRRNRLVLAGVVGLALPFYWMGFIERQEPWLVGGVAVVLAGRLFVGRSTGKRGLRPASV